MEQLLQDLRFGVRILWKSPGLSATAVMLTAMVIGGNTTIYSTVHALLTRPAPGVTAENLYYIGLAGVRTEPFHPYAEYADVLRDTKTLRSLVAYGPERFTVATEDGSYASFGAKVTANYFEALGVRLMRGRAFSETENQLDSGLVAVISDYLWHERFHGREDVIGRFVVLNGFPATVIGIGPPHFQGADLGFPEDVWVPVVSYLRTKGTAVRLSEQSDLAVMVLGQLVPGVSLQSARAEFAALSARLPGEKKELRLVPYSGTANGGISEAGPRFLAIFSVVTAITLLVVCANVANLMLSRAIVRQRETAVRQSLGASRVRLFRMLAAEGLAISILGWAGACLFAVWVSRILVWVAPANAANPLGMRFNHLNVDFSPDWKVLAYAMILAVIGTLAFTIAPAIRACREDILRHLKAGEQSVARARSKMSNALVVTQLAFSVLLLSSAGLVYRSTSVLNRLDLQFDKRDLLLLTVNPTLAIPNRQENLELIERVRQRLATVAGVSAVSYVRLPLPINLTRSIVTGKSTRQPLIAKTNYIGPDYFRTLGITLLAGREFSGSDRSQTSRSVVINRNLAQALWNGEPAVGQTITFGRDSQPAEVIGVVPDVLFSGSGSDAQSNFVFFAEHQDVTRQTGGAGLFQSGETTFYVRYSNSLETTATSIAAAMKEVDGRIPIVYSRTMETQLGSLTLTPRVVTTMLTLFAALSTLIAAIGQYAVAAFDIKRRTREFGIRVAMGASERQILASVLRECFVLTALGLLIGLALGTAVGMALRGVLYGVQPIDIGAYGTVFVILATASLLACYLPARRASRVDPLSALRYE